MNIIKRLVDPSKYNVKCPYTMNPTRIVVHNTSNSASASSEINYMISNNNKVSYHFAVDDKEVIQGIPLDRNAWHAGDGSTGIGNREGISIEICYSKNNSDLPKFMKAEENAAKLIAQLLKERNWDISKVTKHQDYSGKYCPHRTLDMGWKRFLNMVSSELNNKPNNNSNETVVMQLTSSAARLRDTAQGNILKTVSKGQSITIKDFYDWKATDGYRWCWGVHEGIEGAFQYDPDVMHPVGKSVSNLLCMQLHGSPARLRSSVQGNILVTIPNNSEILIEEFLPNKAADGFYWCKGSYNGQNGYFQYDPAVMFPKGNC